MKSLFWALLLVCCLSGVSRAVIITTGDGTGNTTAPPDDPGFGHVGSMGQSGVYLGGGWVLTANHVGVTNIRIGGILYTPVAGSSVQLSTDETNLADLMLFQIEDPPSMPSPVIASVAPAVLEEVVMIGRGKNREPDPTYWDINWLEVALPSAVYKGWKHESVRTIRWGTNTITLVDLDISGAGAVTREFAVDFEDLADEGQALIGDSGGAVFIKRGGEWQLSGIMNFIQPLPGQLADTTVIGSRTYAIDLSFYRAQILAVTTQSIPALSGWGTPLFGIALAGVGVGLARGWRPRRPRLSTAAVRCRQ